MNERISLSDRELIARIKQRDEQALAIAMEKYAPPVYSSAFRVLRRGPDAQEVTQDVFLLLWRSPDRFDGERGQLVTWLVILSRSRALDLLRRIQARAARTRQIRFEVLSRISDRATPDSEILSKELLGRLPENQGCVLQKIYFEGYGFQELSELDGIPLGTIKGRARFALKKLRSELT